MVVFGTKNLRSIGSDLGGAVRNFKQAMNEADETAQLEELKTTHDVAAEKITHTDG